MWKILSVPHLAHAPHTTTRAAVRRLHSWQLSCSPAVTIGRTSPSLRLHTLYANSSRCYITKVSHSLPRRSKELTLRFTRTITSTASSLSSTPTSTTTQPAASSTVPTTNEQLSFPCLDALDSRTADLLDRKRNNNAASTSAAVQQTTTRASPSPFRTANPSSTSGPEPNYTSGGLTQLFHSPTPILLDWGGVLPHFNIAYETWGTLSPRRDNAILLHTGLSASSHAAATEANPKPGWWENFIGSGKPLDTDRFFVICTNMLGGCYGSTGPSSVLPTSSTNAIASDGMDAAADDAAPRYATRFPILTIQDMVRAQIRLLDHLGIEKLYASVGSSLGGMMSLASAVLEKDRVERVVSISGCARSHPYSIAMRHTQRQVLMNDPAWSSTRGNYYQSIPPHAGMKLAREIATITYRSGPEWEQRFGRRRADPTKPPALCPDFLIETYLDHAGEKWCLEYDANSLLYISKAMDLFDLGAENMQSIRSMRDSNASKLNQGSKHAGTIDAIEADNQVLPEQPYEEVKREEEADSTRGTDEERSTGPPENLVQGLMPMRDIPTLVLGVASDILFPAWQQREVAESLRRTGNKNVNYVELGEDRSLFGHDTFLLDVEGVGCEIRKFLL